ncbi:hypothetical protein [Haloplanus salilacus]
MAEFDRLNGCIEWIDLSFKGDGRSVFEVVGFVPVTETVWEGRE